jgi:hypothetical protein
VTDRESEIDVNAYTGIADMEKPWAQARDLKTLLKDAANPETKDAVLASVEDFVAMIDKKHEEIADRTDILKHLNEAQKSVQEIAAAIDSLELKTDMEVMNDTSAATSTAFEAPSGTSSDAADLYAEASELERQIADAKADIDAGGLAASQNSSYADARSQVEPASPMRPDLGGTLAGTPATVGELNQFRDALNQASNEIQDMKARAEGILGRQPVNMSGPAFASDAARRAAAAVDRGAGTVVDMRGFLGGQEGDSGDRRTNESNEGGTMISSQGSSHLKINEERILSVAMPGRRFTNESTRKGWLYLDTWYVIGPWENDSKLDYSVTHPPEFGIDFDAQYRDGKFADTSGHPDKVLKWEFYQSDQVRNQPLRVHGAATYYAYTDVWFEQARDMLIAVASDDAARVWLNGEVIWEDLGQSGWQMGEGYRRVHFRQGINELLVRMENGPGRCVWSVVLCPPEVLNN